MSVVVEAELFAELYCATCETSSPTGTVCTQCGGRLVKLVAATDTFVGRDLDGRFTVNEKLGQGGMGAVYRARQHSIGREVAIKIVHANRMSDPTVIKRFLREAKLLSRLSHPNAVGVLDFGQTDDGVFYLVMELVAGHTLDEELKIAGVFPPARVVRIGTQICDALEAAHGLQIVHRDLKPANIMLMTAARDFVKVLDFGLAKSLEAVTESESRTLGTPAFISPERVNHGTCDGRADLYSLGCILYLLGTGQLPFRSASANDMIAMHTYREPPAVHGVPPVLAEVIRRLLAKDPADRFQTAAEVREALEAALATLASDTEIRPPSPPPARARGQSGSAEDAERSLADSLASTPTGALPRPPRWPWLVLGLVAAAGVAVAIGYTVSIGGDGADAPVGEAHAASPTNARRVPRPRVGDELRDINAPPRTVGNTTEPDDAKPVAPTETKPVAPTETKPVAPTETKPVAPTETKPVAPTETKPVAPTETKPVAPTETKPVAPTDPPKVTQLEPRPPEPARIAPTGGAPVEDRPPAKKIPSKKPRRIRPPAPQKQVAPPPPTAAPPSPKLPF